MPALFRTVYVSKATPRCLDQFTLNAVSIVAQSDRNNRTVGVTGALLAHKGWFLQALEGERAQVSRTLIRIGRDPRHEAIDILGFGPVEARLFPQWFMGHLHLTPALGGLFAEIDRVLGHNPPDALDYATAEDLLARAARAHAASQPRTAAG